MAVEKKKAARPKAIKSKAAPRLATEEVNWDQRLGFLVHDVSRLRRTIFDDYVKPLGITRSQWWILAHLARHDGMIQTDLAKVLELGKAALGGLVERLEAANLLYRRPDEVDRRGKRVFVSPAGYALIARMGGPSHDITEQMLLGMTPEERNTLVALLSKVRHNLRAIKVVRSDEEESD